MSKIIISELDIDVNALIKSTAEVKNAIDVIKKQQSELTKNGETASNQFVQNAADLKTLSSAYNSNLKAIQESTQATADQANREQLLTLALQSEVTTIKEARDQNSLLNKLRNETNVTTKEGQAQLVSLNAKLNSNNDFIKENADNYLKQKINIGNYKSALEGVDVALAKFGINGEQARTVVAGFGNSVTNAGNSFVDMSAKIGNSIAQTIGFKTATQGAQVTTIATTAATNAQAASQTALAGATATSTAATATGTVGLRAFAVALAATGIGLIVVALGLLVNYFSKLDPVLDKIEQGFAAVAAVTNVLVKAITSLSFDGLGESMSKAANGAIKLKEAQQELADLQSSQEVANAKAAQQYDLLIIKSKNRTLSEKERLAFLEKAEKIETANFKQRSALAEKDLSQAIEATRLKAGLTDSEVKKLQQKGIAYQNYLLNAGKITQEEYDMFKKATLERIKILDESGKRLEKRQNAEDKIFEQSQGKAQKAAEDAESRRKKQEEQRQKSIDASIAQQQNELNLLREKSRFETDELKKAEIFAKKELEILKSKLDNKKITQTEYNTEVLKIENELGKKTADLMLNMSKAELDLFLATEKSKLIGAKFLTDELVAEEERRLKLIEKKRIENLAKEKGIDVAKLEAKKLNNEALTVAELEFETQRIQIASDTDNTIQANKKTLEDQIKQQKAEQLLIDKELALAEAQTKSEEDAIKAKQEYDAEMARLIKLLTDKKITEDEFAKLKKKADDENAENERLSRLDDTKDRLNQYAKITAGLEGVFGKNKAIASATAVINGGLAVTEILKAPTAPFVEPFASVIRGVQIAGVVATTARSVAQINGAKFAGGGFVEAKGASHAQGGIPIEIGGRYFGEMQGGEGLAIMNKGAFSHFKEFNNTFGDSDVRGGGFKGGFYASGGIITQGVQPQGVDTTQLANITIDAIRNLPAPQVAVTDINTGANSFVNVVDGANF